MPNISVSVVDGNNITLVTTPTPTQVVTIDRGIAGPPGPAGVPGGLNTQVQYNASSTFDGSFQFTFDDITRITSSNISDGVAMRDGPGFSYGSLLVEAQEPGPTSCFMRPDGLAFYVVGTANDRIQYYSLSTAWNLSTATYVSQSISLVAQTSATHGMFFTSDGLSIFAYGSTAPASIFKYTLSVPWDISTLAYSGSSLNVSAYATGEGSLALSLDGSYLYLLSNTGTPNDVIHWWDLSTPFNLATASYLSYITISPQETIARGLAFSNDGLRMWVTGSVGNDFNIYTLATAWDLNTAVFDFVYPFPIFPTSSRGMYISPNGRFGYIISDVVGAATVYGFSQPVTEWNATGNLNANGNLAVYQNFSVAGQTSLWQASLSGGTVNGVAYLNSTKQIIADTALSFNGSKFEVASATGSLTPVPTEVRISTTTSASDWSTTLPWGRLGYYSADVSAAGPKLVASIDVFAALANGGTANLVINTSDGAGALAERMRFDSAGNVITSTGVFLPYVPAPAATISAVTTLTNAQILPQIVVTSGTTFTLTMPLGTTLETLIAWPKINIGFDFTVINTASGTITMAVSTGVAAVGTLTVLTGISANFRLRRTAANTFIMYRV